MKRTFIAASAALFSLCLTVPAFAGQWMSTDDGRWQYRFNDGSYASEWQWIDGNDDGVSECYYFDENEILWTNCTVPDGSVVNKDGCWIKDGMVVAMVDGRYTNYPDPYAVSNASDAEKPSAQESDSDHIDPEESSSKVSASENSSSEDPSPQETTSESNADDETAASAADSTNSTGSSGPQSKDSVSSGLSRDLAPLSGRWVFDYVYDSSADEYISAADFDRSLSMIVHEQTITREFGGEVYEHDLFDVTDLYSEHGGNMDKVIAVYSDGIFSYQLLSNDLLLLIDDEEDLLFVLKRG